MDSLRAILGTSTSSDKLQDEKPIDEWARRVTRGYSSRTLGSGYPLAETPPTQHRRWVVQVNSQPSTHNETRAEEKPIVGTVLTGDNDDEVARIILRARASGFGVLIVCPEDVDSELPDFVNISDVLVVQPEDTASDTLNDEVVARQQLEIAAKTMSADGVVFVGDTSLPVDLNESINRFHEGGYVTDAVPRGANDVQTLVAIPAYNESTSIESVVQKASQHTDHVLVVDDGSSDRTAALAESAGATVRRHERNRGYGAALKTAFETADRWNVESLVIIDGDGQHDIADISKLTARLEAGTANVVIGSRFTDDATSDIPLYRRFGIGVVNLLTNVSMGQFTKRRRISDTQSGFRAYDDQAIEILADAEISDEMDASLDILYRVQEHRLITEEVPTVVDYSIDDGHSRGALSHGISLVSAILRTLEREHPIKALGVPGFILITLGLTTGYLTLVTNGTLVFGPAAAAGLFVILGVFLGFTAIVLHAMQRYHDIQ